MNEMKTGYKRTKGMKTIEAFVKSGLRRVEIIEFPHCSIDSAQTSLYNTIKRFGYVNIRVSQKRGKLFLVNDGIEEVKLTYYNE